MSGIIYFITQLNLMYNVCKTYLWFHVTLLLSSLLLVSYFHYFYTKIIDLWRTLIGKHIPKCIHIFSYKQQLYLEIFMKDFIRP